MVRDRITSEGSTVVPLSRSMALVRSAMTNESSPRSGRGQSPGSSPSTSTKASRTSRYATPGSPSDDGPAAPLPPPVGEAGAGPGSAVGAGG